MQRREEEKNRKRIRSKLNIKHNKSSSNKCECVMRMTFDLSISDDFSPRFFCSTRYWARKTSTKWDEMCISTDMACSCLLSFVYLFLWSFVDCEIVNVSRKQWPLRWMTNGSSSHADISRRISLCCMRCALTIGSDSGGPEKTEVRCQVHQLNSWHGNASRVRMNLVRFRQ